MVTWVIRVGQKLATAHVRSGVSHCVDMRSLHKRMVVPRAELENAVVVSLAEVLVEGSASVQENNLTSQRPFPRCPAPTVTHPPVP